MTSHHGFMESPSQVAATSKKGSDNHGKHNGIAIAAYVQIDYLIFSKLSIVQKLQDVPLAIQHGSGQSPFSIGNFPS